MAAVIGELAAQRQFSLTTPDRSLVLYNEPFTRLVIGVEAPYLVSVAHRPITLPHQDPVSDPDMLFYTGDPAAWVPVEITLITGSYQQAAVLEDGQISGIFPRALADLVSFADLWAQNLRDQGWLADATSLDPADA